MIYFPNWMESGGLMPHGHLISESVVEKPIDGQDLILY